MKKLEYINNVLSSVILVILVILVALALQNANAMTIATGKIDGEYYKRGVEFCKDKVNCNVMITNGSGENLLLLTSHKVEYAILQEDFLAKINHKIETSNSIKEYLHIVYDPKHNIKSLLDFKQLTTISNNGEGEDGILHNIIFQPKIMQSDKDVTDQLCYGYIDYKVYIRSKDNATLKTFIKECGLEIFSFTDNLVKYPLEDIQYGDKIYKVPVIQSFIVKLRA